MRARTPSGDIVTYAEAITVRDQLLDQGYACVISERGDNTDHYVVVVSWGK